MEDRRAIVTSGRSIFAAGFMKIADKVMYRMEFFFSFFFKRKTLRIGMELEILI